INFIDTADIYSRWVEGNAGGVAETILGRWMKSRAVPRHHLVIATKVRGPMGDQPNDQGLSRAHIMHAVEESLRRLDMDYIDLYQTHYYDENTAIDETLRALDDLVRQGKVRYLGCSNYPAWRLMRALWTSERLNLARYETLQPHYSLVHRAEFERELADVCRAYELGVIPYSPLAGGFLTGKYRRDHKAESARAGGAKKYFNDRNWNLLDAMEKMGQQKDGASISQIALAWQLSNPVITSPIIGPRNHAQLQDNLGAAGLRLSAEQQEQLDDLTRWQEQS
ncbi:MAG TPA: aldo/keto reductase, partial [Anaerolineales bacterium]|nr:aldo/keto reductase [Anaerolineales bacterium]